MPLITRTTTGSSPGDDRGQAALIVLMLAVFFLLLLGLVSDGGLLLSQRRDLQGLADGAARAGAAAIDPSTIRTDHLQIDPAVAQSQIDRYLAAAGFSGSAQVSPTPAQVRVELSGTYSLAFAKLVGIGSATLHATSTSDPIPSGQ